MNDVVSFQSKGLIDPRCITTIGVSVKETENPIGFFGTGLKYAIAIVLRNGGSIVIWRGLEPYRFSTHEVEVRGKPMQIVCMNDRELGFTTDLGKHWELWQSFREIYCNTVDEGGTNHQGEVPPAEGMTTVQVKLAAFAECFAKMGDYILQTDPVFTTPQVEFHSASSRNVFYRSIRVANNLSQSPFQFTPNLIARVDLTEDRTLKNPWDLWQNIAKSILTGEDRRFIERWLTVHRDFAEHNIDLDWPSIAPGEVFLEVVEMLMRDVSRPLNITAATVLSKHRAPPEPVEAELLNSEKAALQKAIAFCHALKYPVDEFPILIVESLGEGILGAAHRNSRHVYIARRAIQMGDLTLAATLIEEWAHIKHGFDDCSREMQNWLFENLTRIGSAYLFEIQSEREAA